VAWIEDGLALRASDIECRPESMIHDMIHIVHQLVTGLTVLADDQTWMMRVKGTHSALVFGKDFEGQEKPIRIQYIFQRPGGKNIEMFTVTYHLAPSVDVVQAMSEFVMAIEKGGDSPDIAADEIVQALLEGNHERASSVARSIGVEVQHGLD
jgi:hypothetical protein